MTNASSKLVVLSDAANRNLRVLCSSASSAMTSSIRLAREATDLVASAFRRKILVALQHSGGTSLRAGAAALAEELLNQLTALRLEDAGGDGEPVVQAGRLEAADR